MKAYILVSIFVVSLSLINEFYLFKLNKNKIIVFTIMLSSILGLAFVAGVRDTTVGADINVYVMRLFNLSNSFGNNLLGFLRNSGSDLFFAIVVYIGSLFNDIHVVLFLIEICVCTPIFFFAYLQRKNISYTAIIFVFLMTMYVSSLNNMRQSIAISLCVLSYHFILEKKDKISLLLIFSSFLFHKTGLIFLSVYLIEKFIKQDRNRFSLKLVILIVPLLLFLPIVDNLISLSGYSYYIEAGFNYRDFSINSITKKLLFVVMWGLTFTLKDEIDRNKSASGLIYSIIALYCTFLSFSFPGMGRLGYYFTDLQYFLIVGHFYKVFKQKRFMSLMTCALFALLWWDMTKVENDSAKVYPYKSEIVTFFNE